MAFSRWFKQIGGTLCLTIFLNIYTPHILRIFLALKTFFLRWYDRGFKNELRIDDYFLLTTSLISSQVYTKYKAILANKVGYPTGSLACLT